MQMDPDIDEVVGKQSEAIQSLTHALRAAIKAAQPDLTEDASVKLGVIYFRHKGVVVALSPHKQHVNMHFYKGTQLSDPDGVLQGGGKALRHLKFVPGAPVDGALITRFVREAHGLNARE